LPRRRSTFGTARGEAAPWVASQSLGRRRAAARAAHEKGADLAAVARCAAVGPVSVASAQKHLATMSLGRDRRPSNQHPSPGTAI
jgi:hypothetical protein